MNASFENIRDKLHCLRDPKITVAQIMECMASTGFPSTLLALSIMTILVPVPKVIPLNIFFTLPFIYIGWQMLKGDKEPTLPKWLAEKEFKNHKVKVTADRAFRLIDKFEGYAKPALSRVISFKKLTQAMGLTVLFLSLSMILPLPFTSTLPSILISIMAMGQIHKDGRLVVAGMIGAAIWMVILLSLVGEIADELGDVIEWTFSALA